MTLMIGRVAACCRLTGPSGLDQAPDAYKDPQGRFTGLFMLTFANSYNKQLVAAGDAPKDYADFLKPAVQEPAACIAYPHDDDAVLYVFDRVVQQYGIGLIPTSSTPTACSGCAAHRRHAMRSRWAEAAVSTGTSGAFVPMDSANTRFVLPTHDPFLTWAAQNRGDLQGLETSGRRQAVHELDAVAADAVPTSSLPLAQGRGAPARLSSPSTSTTPIPRTSWPSCVTAHVWSG